MKKTPALSVANSQGNGLSKDHRRENQWYLAWRILRRNPLAMFGMVGLCLIVATMILAPVLAPFEPTAMDYKQVLQPPTSAHPFGTDDLGRDILSRVLYGGQLSLRVAVMVIVIAMGGGVLVGLTSGYFGGWVDTIIMRIVDILLAFPTILLLLSIVAALGPSLTAVLIAIAFSSIPAYSRLVRGSVLSAKNNDYVMAAQVIGARSTRIMVKHILPNIIPPVIIYATLGLAGAIMLTAGLSYLGLGAQPPSPEWGAMLNAGRSLMRDAWWMSVFPGLAIFWTVLCINLLGDGLRDALDPRLKNIQ
jgi:peptide/nickel transport system permease protein